MPKAARARVASPPAGTALARAIRDCLPGRVRHRRGSEFYVTETATYVNVGVTRNHPEIRAAQPRTLKDDGTQSRLLPTLELNYLQNRQASILVGASAAPFESRNGLPSRKQVGFLSRPPQDDGGRANNGLNLPARRPNSG